MSALNMPLKSVRGPPFSSQCSCSRANSLLMLLRSQGKGVAGPHPVGGLATTASFCCLRPVKLDFAILWPTGVAALWVLVDEYCTAPLYPGLAESGDLQCDMGCFSMEGKRCRGGFSISPAQHPYQHSFTAGLPNHPGDYMLHDKSLFGTCDSLHHALGTCLPYSSREWPWLCQTRFCLLRPQTGEMAFSPPQCVPTFDKMHTQNTHTQRHTPT